MLEVKDIIYITLSRRHKINANYENFTSDKVEKYILIKNKLLSIHVWLHRILY